MPTIGELFAGYGGLGMAVQAVYGGRLTENVTQAVARDVLGAALIELAERGYSVVGHVHDEVLVEGGPEDLDEVVDAMCDKPSWAAGLPIAAEAFTTNRYRKD